MKKKQREYVLLSHQRHASFLLRFLHSAKRQIHLDIKFMKACKHVKFTYKKNIKKREPESLNQKPLPQILIKSDFEKTHSNLTLILQTFSNAICAQTFELERRTRKVILLKYFFSYPLLHSSIIIGAKVVDMCSIDP